MGGTYRSARLLVREPPATWRFRQKSIVGGRLKGEIDRRRSIEGEKGRKKKKKKKKEKRRKKTYRPRAVLARVPSPLARRRCPLVAGTLSHAQGESSRQLPYWYRDELGMLTERFVRIRRAREINQEAVLLSLCSKTFTQKVIIFSLTYLTVKVFNFSGTKQAAHRLKIIFGLSGMKAAELHGNLTQAQRLDVSNLLCDFCGL
ncbi:hypothetical protein GW17_00027405 [Ensete ventricosum]|nr:hypothetical protein GW17_00027405 [Ensete ventricosum]